MEDEGNPLPESWVVDILHQNEPSHIPVQNVERIMRRVLPCTAKIERDAKALVQECVSEFIGVVTDGAKIFMEGGQRKTVTAPDIVLALEDLWFKPLAARVRRHHWHETSLKPSPSSSRKKRNREPPSLKDAQLRCAASLCKKRWRGQSVQEAAPEHTPATQARLALPIARVYTYQDVQMIGNGHQQLQHPLRSQLDQAETKSSLVSSSGDLTSDEDLPSLFVLGNDTFPAIPTMTDFSALLNHCVNESSSLNQAAAFDTEMLATVPELGSVLNSPQPITFPKTEALRAHHITVRSTDPFGIDCHAVLSFGIEVDTFNPLTIAVDHAEDPVAILKAPGDESLQQH